MSLPESRACSECAYQSERLLVQEWHSFEPQVYDAENLARDVAAMLTERVTESLPPSWHGEYSLDRARSWIQARDKEGTTLLVINKQTGEPLGLIILFDAASRSPTKGVDLRLGYLLSESAWGQGYATEMLVGLCDWCRGQESIISLKGGVGRGNVASRWVLEKIGFQLLEAVAEEDIFELALRG